MLRFGGAAQGDVCLLLSYRRLLSAEQLALHLHNLVVQESTLPQGQGWSPMNWRILEGFSRIPITLSKPTADLDADPIFLQQELAVQSHKLVDEWRALPPRPPFTSTWPGSTATVTCCSTATARWRDTTGAAGGRFPAGFRALPDKAVQPAAGCGQPALSVLYPLARTALCAAGAARAPSIPLGPDRPPIV